MPLASDHERRFRAKGDDSERPLYIAKHGAPGITMKARPPTFLEAGTPLWGNVPGKLIAGNNKAGNATPGPGHYQALTHYPPPGARRKPGGFDACVAMESFRNRSPRWRFQDGGTLTDEERHERKMKKESFKPGPGQYRVYGDFPVGPEEARTNILSTRQDHGTPRWSPNSKQAGAFRACWLDKEARRTTQKPSFEHEQELSRPLTSQLPAPERGPSWTMGRRRNDKGETRAKGEGPGPGYYATYGMFARPKTM